MLQLCNSQVTKGFANASKRSVNVNVNVNAKITCGESKWYRKRFNRKRVDADNIKEILKKKSIYDKMRFQDTSDVLLRGVANDISKLSEVIKELKESAEELKEYLDDMYDDGDGMDDDDDDDGDGMYDEEDIVIDDDDFFTKK